LKRFQQGRFDSAGFAAAGVIVGVIILNVIFTGFVLKILWSWFVAQTFGIMELNIPQALGLSIMVSCLVPTPKETSSVPFITGLVMLTMGAIVKAFL